MAASTAISAANAAFWNELCGSALARMLDITDDSPTSLERFDRWYFEFYPYLAVHIPFTALAGKRVLEVGLGYGSVSQRLAAAGVVYHGLDIAAGPVSMVQHRLSLLGLTGDVRQGSILDCPWPDEAFDYVVAIGCYHHTGNLERAIAETRRVLVSGGETTIMVYNAYSHRRWLRWPLTTAQGLMAELTGSSAPPPSAAERAAYDTNSAGNIAPETVFTSARYLRHIMNNWAMVSIARENVDLPGPLRRVPRRLLLPTVGRWCGLDLYCRAVK